MTTRWLWYDGVVVLIRAYDERQKKILSWLGNDRGLAYVVGFCRLYDLPCNVFIEYVS